MKILLELETPVTPDAKHAIEQLWVEILRRELAAARRNEGSPQSGDGDQPALEGATDPLEIARGER
ncbi:MAG: hypothetical protein ACRD1S_00805 [Vicinamibacterales bacterium]